MRCRRALAGGFGAALLLSSSGLATSAKADAPARQGWWTITNPGELPATLPALPTDVPSNGLLVQGGPPGQPAVYAALNFDILDGLTATSVLLHVTTAAASNPAATLEVCPLTVPGFSPEQGGPIADAPAYDCTTSATATEDVTASSFTFDVSKLPQSGTLGLALLPTNVSDRVVFDQPGSDALATTGVATSSDSSGSNAGAESSTGSSAPTTSTAAPVTTAAGTGAGGGSTVPAASVPAGTSTTATGLADAPTAALPAAGVAGSAAAAPAPDVAAAAPAATVDSAAAPTDTTSAVANTTAAATGSGNRDYLLLLPLLLGAGLWAVVGRREGVPALDSVEEPAQQEQV